MSREMGVRQQQGAALIFALLISILMGVFAGYFTFKAKQNIEMAERVSNRLELLYQADSAIYKSLYAAMNLGFTGIDWPDDDKQYPMLLWGQELHINENEVISYQDLSGKLNIIPFKPSEWRSILVAYGKTEIEAAAITDKVEDWMDSDNFRRLQGLESRGYGLLGNGIKPRNSHMQLVEELSFIPGIDAELLLRMKDEIAYWGTPSRSPFVGSEAMIKAYTSEEQRLEIMQQRERKESLRSQYNKLTKVDASLVNDVPSGIFRVRVQVQQGTARFVRVVDVNLLGIDTMPFYFNGWQ